VVLIFRITHDYTVASARALSTLGTPSTPFKYIFVSGMGADQAEKGWAIFSRVKGRAEKALVNIENESDNSFRAVNIRPGGIIPTDERKAQLPWLARVGVPLLGYVMPSRMIHANDVATAALQLAATEDGWEKRDKEQLIIENDGLNEIAKRYAQVWQS
jgi:hypothetical protein